MGKRLLLLLVLLGSINCLGQNNKYQFQMEQYNHYDEGAAHQLFEQGRRMTDAYNQAVNQIWSNLERINNFMRQGDYENANLLIDRCIQLNTQYQYHLYDHNTLLQKKNEIANAKSRSNSQNYYQPSNNYNNNYTQNNYATDEVTQSYLRAFNSYVKSAYGEYELGNYSEARSALNEAYRIYDQQKLSLTQQESDSYNKLNDLLKKVESAPKALNILNLVNTYNNGSYGIANFLQNNGFQYSHDYNGTKNYICGSDGAKGSVSFNEKQKMILYFFPASLKSGIFNEINGFATFRGNRKDNENGMEYQGFVYSNFYIELSTKTIPMAHSQFYILRIFKVEQAANNTNNNSQDNVSQAYKKSFNSYLQNAYSEYDAGYYQSSREALNNAYRIFDEQKLSLTREESDKYNQLDYLLREKEKSQTNNQKYTPNNNSSSSSTNIQNEIIHKDNPSYKTLAQNITIKRVIVTNKETIVELSVTNRFYNGWIQIYRNTHLKVGSEIYDLMDCEGIELAPKKTYISRVGETRSFTLYFLPIPKSTTKMDLIEPGTSDWKFYDIQLQ